jgi:hypothetical protein
MRTYKGDVVRWALLSLCVVAILAGVGLVVIESTSLPENWDGKEEFCTQAGHLGVGEPNLSREERASVLRQLRENAPEPLQDEFTSIVADPNSVDREMLQDVGKFIEARCEMNLPGVSTDG